MSLTTRSIVLFSTALIFLPAGIIWGERALGDFWQQPLLLAPLVTEPPLNTFFVTEGTVLPPVITTSTTYATTDNPLILSGQTVVPSGVIVTLEPGVEVMANEFSSIDVFGTLNSKGTATTPVTLATNLAHPDQQTWAGIFARAGSVVNLEHTMITDASPAISCLKNSTVSLTAVDIFATLIGIYSESDNCRISDSRIRAIKDGVVAVGNKPSITNTVISAGGEEIRVVLPLTTDN